MSIWLAYRVTPQLEFHCAEAIDKLGTERVLVPKSKVTIRGIKGRPRIVTRPLAPGYVFAAYHGWQAFADAFVACKLVRGWRGVVGADNRPWLLSPMDVRALYAMEVAAAEPHVEAGMKPGDRINIRKGLHANLHAVVARLDKGSVIATVTMFGRPHDVAIPMDQIEAA